MRADIIGPCTGCGAPHERYGSDGRPHCHGCFPSTAAHARQAAGHQAVISAPKAEPRLAEPRLAEPRQAEPEAELSLF